MRMRVVGQTVGADHGGGMREDAAHVLLVNAVIDGAGRLQRSRGIELR